MTKIANNAASADDGDTGGDDLSSVISQQFPDKGEQIGYEDDPAGVVMAEFFKRQNGEGSESTDPTSTATADSTDDDASHAASTLSSDATPSGESGDDAPDDTGVHGVSDNEGAPSPTTYNVTVDGQTLALDERAMQEMVALTQWAQNLDPRAAQAMAAVEQGHAVAIGLDEYEAFRAWQAAGQPVTREGAGGRNAPDLDDLDPDTREAVQALMAERDALAAEAQRLSARPDASAVLREQQRIASIAETFDASAAAWGQERGLSDDEMERVYAAAVSAQVIPTLVERDRVLNPVNGQVIRDADYGRVARQALDFALLQDPDLHTRVLNRQVSGAPVATPVVPAVDPVAAKKARAGSLSSAPSASTFTPSRDPRSLTPQERVQAMADDLRASMNA
jgi:hypothetical protein